MQEIMSKLINTPAGTNVFRSRTEALTRAESPSIVVRAAREDVEQQLAQRMHRRLQIQVDVILRGAVPDSLADDTIVDVHSKLMADQRLVSGDPPVGLCEYIEELGTEWTIGSADLDAALVTLGYEIEYRTSIQDLTVYA